MPNGYNGFNYNPDAQPYTLYTSLGNAATFLPPAEPAVTLHITAPLNHSLYILNPDTPPGLAVLPLRVAASGGAAQVEWYVDGQPYQTANAGDTVDWPATPGRHVFEVATPSKTSKSKTVIVLVQ